MARPRLSGPQDADFEDAINTEFDDVSKLVADQEAEEETLIQEFGEATGDRPMHFHVKKKRKDSKLLDHCFQGSVSDLPVMERIQREFGGGTYEIWLFRSGKLYRKMLMGVAEPKAPMIAPQAGTDPALLELLRSMGEKMNAAPPAQTNMGQLLRDAAPFVAAAAPILAGLFNRAAPDPGQQMLVMVQTMQALKEMTEPPGADREKGFLDVIGDVAPKLIEAMGNSPRQIAGRAQIVHTVPQNQQIPPQRLTPQNPVQTPPQPEPAQETLVSGGASDTTQQDQMAELTAQLEILCKAAARNAPHDLYADLIEDQCAPEMLAFLLQPGAIEVLTALYAPVNLHRPWFEAVLTSLANGASDEGDVPSAPHSAVPSGVDPGRHSGGSDDIESDVMDDEEG